MSNRLPNLLLFLSLIYLFATNCSERDRSNPFDPGSTISSPIELIINPHNNTTRLSWIVKNVTDFVGFRLYRALDNENYVLYKEFGLDISHFVDSSLVYYHWYHYRISIMGQSHETPPSNTVRMLCGPGDIWILTRYGYSIREMSYDLLHTKQLFSTIYPAISWDWNRDESEIWMAHAQFRYISKFNLIIGAEDYFYQDGLQRPVDIKWDNQLNRINVLDPVSKRIIMVREQTIEDTVTLENDQFFKILITPQSETITIDTHSVCIFNSMGNLDSRIYLQAGFEGGDIILDGSNVHILSVNYEQKKSRIGVYDLSSHNFSEVEISGKFNIFRKHSQKHYYWVSEILDNNSSRGVKLSSDGIRLLELASLSYFIDDLRINPYDESVILLQNYANNIILYDSTGTMLSSNNQIYDPVKIYIQ